jgi:hypothetical protein
MERVNHPQEDFFTMTPSQFTFNKNLKCEIFLHTKTQRVAPLQRSSKIAEIDAVFCPATYSFEVKSLNCVGRFELNYQKNFFISFFEIGQTDVVESKTPVKATILSEDFFNSAIAAACEIGSTRAMWYPPNSLIPDASGSTSIAGKEGFTKYLTPTPSGGRGSSRKVLDEEGKRHDRVWNDPIEIQRTVAFMEIAEALFKSPHAPKDQFDLSTKAKREQWVADELKIWSVGTVHVQLAIARKNGLIKSGRKKK